MPDSPEWHLSPGIKIKDILEAYNEELTVDSSINYMRTCVSKSCFHEMMKSEFPCVKKRKWVRFTKCGKCTYLEDLLKNPDLSATQRGMQNC